MIGGTYGKILHVVNQGWMLDRVNAVMEDKISPLPPDELS